MRDAETIANEILILKLGEKNNAAFERSRLIELINRVDADIKGGMLKNREKFISRMKENLPGAADRVSLTMLNAVFKSLPDFAAVSMLGKVLLSESADEDFTFALLYRLLEINGLTIKKAPFGCNILKNGISGNKLAEYTEPVCDSAAPALSQNDLITALFILNDEPSADVSMVGECEAMKEYKRLAAEAAGMEDTLLERIADFTTHPDTALLMGLNAVRRMGKSVELRKETLEGFIMSILRRQSADQYTADV